MILSLLWKDLRLTVPVLLAAAIFTIAPYLCVFALTYTMAPGSFPWAEAVMAGAHFSQWLMLLTGALLGANAFASEREDGSADFLMSLPAKSRDVLFSKAIVTLMTFECLWIANAAVVHAMTPFATVGFRDKLIGAAGMPTIASLSLAVLGLSWCWSALMARPVIAAMFGLLSCGLFLAVFRVGIGFLRAEKNVTEIGGFVWIAILLGAVGFIAGALLFHYRERIPAFSRPKAAMRYPTGCNEAQRDRRDSLPPRQPYPLVALIWKDWRMIGILLFTGTLLIAAPYVYATGIALVVGELPKVFARASTQSLWLCCPVFSVWGGYLVVAEQRTRANYFLDALPVSRTCSALSKLILAAIPSLVILGVNAGLALGFHNAAFLPAPIGESGIGFSEMTWSLLLWQQTSLLFALPVITAPLVCFGVAWIASIRLVKPFLGIAIGVISTGVTLVAWMAFSTLFEDRLAPFPATLVFAVLGCVIATTCILCGLRDLAGKELA